MKKLMMVAVLMAISSTAFAWGGQPTGSENYWSCLGKIHNTCMAETEGRYIPGQYNNCYACERVECGEKYGYEQDANAYRGQCNA